MIATTPLRKKLLDLAVNGKLVKKQGEWKTVTLGEVSRIIGTKQHQILAKEIQTEGAYPVVSQGKEMIDGYSNEKDKVISDIPLVLFGDHTKNVKFIDFEFIVGADGTKLFAPVDDADAKWLFYWTSNAADKLCDRGYGRHWSLLNKIQLSLPPLAEQRAIVAKVEELFAVLDAMKGEAAK